ncbi:hypothetical protein SAMN00768000_2347 [Sulfobacillus thermosulfidooxidans DSM 9293]|uniref:Uncharacterized protein n=1 Tax=Sulfobacillus thermosulfidooxidans (strain DSM 9293 / VKM B-1269 / AT-1) TaxID=929705 RepID=A0A1W1WH94_SULTA|nr:hypothetical protein [Sulfobacillus thermosulfidooxidans]SMC05615.1 hypothetical protein SAMN00768000_2347 [Sulfobacillus thermosulfidooxidans DSM 9293]
MLVTFGVLHGSTGPLVLPNAWDVVSAEIFEKASSPLWERPVTALRKVGC